jgi:hypothetical protein
MTDYWADYWGRLMDDLPGPIDEVVIKTLDAVREYRGLLLNLEHDAPDNGWSGEEIGKLKESVARCDQLIEELDGWGLNPDLRAGGQGT